MKKFTKDKKAWVIGNGEYQSEKTCIEEVHVLSVGPKYVTAQPKNSVYPLRFRRDQNIKDEDGLREVKDYGHPRYLFSSQQAAQDHMERLCLFDYVALKITELAPSDISLAGLRSIRSILDDEKGD